MRYLAKDLEICEKATPGPWKYDYYLDQIFMADDGSEVIVDTTDTFQVDSVFIAESRAGWPEAIQRAITAEKALAQLVEAIENRKRYIVYGLALMQAVEGAKKVLRGEEA